MLLLMHQLSSGSKMVCDARGSNPGVQRKSPPVYCVGTFTNKALLLSMTSHQATGDVCTSTCLIGKR